MRKAVGFSPTPTIKGRFLSCGFKTSAAYVQLEFGESAASIGVRLLIKCDFYTRLYGNLEAYHVEEDASTEKKYYC